MKKQSLPNQLGPSHRKAPATSEKAAHDNFPRSGTQRYKVLIEILLAGEQGISADRIEANTALGHSSVWPRIRELVDQGWVAYSERKEVTRRGSEALALVVTDEGLVALDKLL